MIAGGAFVVDVRDAPEVEPSGKVAGAVHVLARNARVPGRSRIPLPRAESHQGQAGDPVLRGPAVAQRFPARRSRRWATRRCTTSVVSVTARSGARRIQALTNEEDAGGPRTVCGTRPRVDRGSLQPSGLRLGPVVQSDWLPEHRQGCPNLARPSLRAAAVRRGPAAPKPTSASSTACAAAHARQLARPGQQRHLRRRAHHRGPDDVPHRRRRAVPRR